VDNPVDNSQKGQVVHEKTKDRFVLYNQWFKEIPQVSDHYPTSSTRGVKK